MQGCNFTNNANLEQLKENQTSKWQSKNVQHQNNNDPFLFEVQIEISNLNTGPLILH